eukprot:7390423-Prymnesium_polylepis.1
MRSLHNDAEARRSTLRHDAEPRRSIKGSERSSAETRSKLDLSCDPYGDGVRSEVPEVRAPEPEKSAMRSEKRDARSGSETRDDPLLRSLAAKLMAVAPLRRIVGLSSPSLAARLRTISYDKRKTWMRSPVERWNTSQ